MPVKNADIIENHAVLATELSDSTLEECSRPMGVRRILTIIRQVLDGLSHAHHKHVLHCDVTPGNIFLFSNGSAAIGDFGIGIKISGRMKTIDDFGTPGYVAPEQAFGKPTYRSDCFSVALVLYEFLTGVLLRWPFNWPPRGLQRLRDRTGVGFVRFMKKALELKPEKRFANAGQMLSALDKAVPSRLRKKLLGSHSHEVIPDWQQTRRKSFFRKYLKVFTNFYPCFDCGEPNAETMHCCPWCGSKRNRFDDCTKYSHICHRCHKGVAPQWDYCPWCYGPGFIPQEPDKTTKLEYQGKCNYCYGKTMHFMKYCPWCRRKIKHKWQVWPFPEICASCGWSVDSSYWNWCPWCNQRLN
jgi:serine/threonine protein kinase